MSTTESHSGQQFASKSGSRNDAPSKYRQHDAILRCLEIYEAFGCMHALHTSPWPGHVSTDIYHRPPFAIILHDARGHQRQFLVLQANGDESRKQETAIKLLQTKMHELFQQLAVKQQQLETALADKDESKRQHDARISYAPTPSVLWYVYRACLLCSTMRCLAE